MKNILLILSLFTLTPLCHMAVANENDTDKEKTTIPKEQVFKALKEHDKENMDHTKMQDMDHSKMQDMDHSKMKDMDHSKMQDMDHSKMKENDDKKNDE